jgi:hypothetical protein
LTIHLLVDCVASGEMSVMSEVANTN